MELSRVEHILKYFLGEADTLPQPLSRVEELLIALGELISSGAVSSPIKIKGRVDTVYDLPSNAEPGWMYYVGPASASEFAEYVYLDSGEWQYTGTSNSAIDIALSTTSTNPVENRVITEAINLINQTLSDKVDKVTGKGLSTEDFTTEEKAKLSSIETGANANVQADWNQNDSAADDFIKNKPTIPDQVVVDQTYNAFSANAQSGTAVAGALDDKVDKVTGKGLSTEDYTTAEKEKLYSIESGAQANVQADWNQTDNTADDFIKNKPDITFVQVNADWNATSGVAQILNKPNIPEGVIVDLVYDPTSEHAQAGVAVAEAITNKVDKTGNNMLSGLFEPSSNNGATLGSSNYKFSALYTSKINGNTMPSGSGTIALTSDIPSVPSLPITVANGGTGATSASSARTNLGLGSAATYSATSSVTSGSSSLVTSGAVYSAIPSYSAGTGLTKSGTTFSVTGPETVTITLNSSCVSLDSQSVYKDPGTGWVYGTWKCTVTKAFSTTSNTAIVSFPSGSRLTTGQVPVQCYSTTPKTQRFYISWLNVNVVRVFSAGVASSDLPSVGDTLVFSVGFFNQSGI